MIRVQATDIDRQGVHIPGGWTVKMPEPLFQKHEEDVYIRYYVSQGVHAGVAADIVRQSFRQLWITAWLENLRTALARMAVRYQKMHPGLGLRGFDPEIVQVAYVPGDNVGARGKPAVTELLRFMGQTQREHERGG